MVRTHASPDAPTATHLSGTNDAAHVTREILTRLFGSTPPAGTRFHLWDGTEWPAQRGGSPHPTATPTDAPTTIRLNHPGALRAMLLPPTDLAMGEAFVHGLFDIVGEIEGAFRLYTAIGADARSPRSLLPILGLLRKLPEAPRDPADGRGAAQQRGGRHSRARDRSAVRYHYDLSNDFYALWLDRRMVYTCAYFPTGAEDLDAAQEAKLDLICRKLRLKPGERVLDIGCGWGGFIQFAAERYGAEATGVTLSEQQAIFARERIAAAGLSGRVRVIHSDYRDLPRGSAFDKIVSIGMFEQVGYARLPEYFRTAYRYLKPGGLFLNHGIAEQHYHPSAPRRVFNRLIDDRRSFVQRYVFPDGDLVSLSYALAAAEGVGWEVRDVESLREHYARTLRLWGARLATKATEATALIGTEAYRVWQLYMAGSAYNFDHERLSLYQALLAKPDANGHLSLPPTRADIYGGTG